MIRRLLVISFVLVLNSLLMAQGIQDSIFKLPSVKVVSQRIFDKENAGMKETHIDSMAIKTNISLSLSELLSEHSSVFIKSHGRGALASASFRGTAASHTQVNWNGVNINSPMTGMVDFSLIPVYVIDDLSLQHGNASIASHSGGIGGAISIDNRPDWNNRTSVKYVQGLGSFHTFDEFIHFKIGNKKFQSSTRLYHSYSKNDYTFINRNIVNIDPETQALSNPLDTNKNADYKKYGFLQECYVKLTPSDIVSLKIWAQKSARSIPKATSNEGAEQSNINRQSLSDIKALADWKHYWERSDLSLKSAWVYSDMLFTVKNQVSGWGMLPILYAKSKQKSSLNSLQYKYLADWGLSVESSLSFNYHSVSSFDTVKQLGYSADRAEYAAFLALRKQWFKRLNVNLMIRKEWQAYSGLPFIPFLGFDYAIVKDGSWLLKGNVSKNYHRPSLNDLYWQPGGNADLKPEKGYSAELGLETVQQFSIFSVKAELNAYASKIDDWIIWLPSFKGHWTPSNVKKVEVKGLESNWGLSTKIKKVKLKINAGYAYTQSINYGDPLVWGDESYGKQLVYIPVHSANVFAEIAYRNWHLSYMHNTFSERFTSSSNQVNKRDRLYPYFMNDLSLEYRAKIKKYDVSLRLNIYNLFNETYHTVLYRPMPKINYGLLLSVGF